MKKVLVLEDESSIRSFVLLILNVRYEPIEADTERRLLRIKRHPISRLPSGHNAAG